ncbi:cytochrome P450 306a1 isoform X2 [Culicoides brevitarsis]
MWFLLLTSLLVIYLLQRYFKLRDCPPGPFSIPILGYLPFLDPQQPYVSLTNLAKRYGPIYSLQLGNIFTVVLSDNELIRDALKREEFAGRAPLYVTHGIMGGYGIICAEGDQWRDQRKLSIEWLRKLGMTKFGTTRDAMQARILLGVEEYVKDLKNEMKKQFDVNPFHILHNALGNVMNDFVFGEKYEKNDETWKYLQHLQEEGVKHIGVSGVVNFLPFLRHLPANSSTINFLLEGKKKTHAIYDKIIAKCQANLASYRESIVKYFLIDRELRGKSIKFGSDEQLRHLLADLFGAGVDTTLTTIRWFILFTARDRVIQEKLRYEMHSVLQSAPTLDDVEKLPFMRATIAETQRIRSVVPLGIPHGTTKETKIGKYRIPEGTMVIPLMWAVHMDEKKWKEPEKFMPDRFITENGNFETSSNLIPFQTGKRMCLGEELAKMLLFLFCSNFVYNFSYEVMNPASLDMKGTCGITLTPPDYSLIIKEAEK